jgi:GMP synthase (glutamine-hydrolysing)
MYARASWPPRVVVLVAGTTVPVIAARRGDFPRWIGAHLLAARLVAHTFHGSHGSPGGHPSSAELGRPLVRVAVRDLRGSAPLPGPRDADAFIITGSSSSVTERAPWMLRAEHLVRSIVAARVPLLGICFGHQLVAQALGGHVARNPRGREIGTVRLQRIADDPLFAGLPRVVDVNATHVDSVVRLPPGAEILGMTALEPVAAFRVGRSVSAVQFHPEFDADVMRAYLRARAHLIREEGGDPAALLARVHEGTRGADMLHNFARGLGRASGAAAGGRTQP